MLGRSLLISAGHASQNWSMRCGAVPSQKLLFRRMCRPRVLCTQTGERESTKFSQPPFPVRATLVGATTALATPIFSIIGLNQLLFRFSDPTTNLALTGGSTPLYFSVMVLFPNENYYAPLLLPFAVGNGLVATGVYTAAEVGAGGPAQLVSARFLFIPVAGPLIGFLTAVFAPFVYPLSFAVVFPTADFWEVAATPKIYSQIFDICLGTYGWILFPCLASTGLISGFFIHIVLKHLVLGVPGIAWQKLSGGALGCAVMALGALYSTALRTDQAQHLTEVHLDRPELNRWLFAEKAHCFVNGLEEVFWVPTIDVHTGSVVSESRKPVKVEDKWYEFQKGTQTAGAEKAFQARVLRNMMDDSRVECYTSQRAAFFQGLIFPKIDKTEVKKAAGELRPGETLVTDLLVLVAVGSVPHGKLEESVSVLLPFLKDSIMSGSLLGSDFVRSTANEDDPSALLHTLALRAAQLRELVRLECGEVPGPIPARELETALSGVGIDLCRARASVAELRWEPCGGDRAADWDCIKGLQRRSRVERVAGILALSVLIGATTLSRLLLC